MTNSNPTPFNVHHQTTYECTFRLDGEFSVSLKYADCVFIADWHPNFPSAKKFRQLHAAYAKVRAAFMDKVAEETGDQILLFDADGSLSVFERSDV